MVYTNSTTVIYCLFQRVKKGDVETYETQTSGLRINSIADSLSLNFLVCLVEMSSYFSMETNKRKVRKCLKCMKGFLHIFDLKNRKYFSVFQGFCAVIV